MSANTTGLALGRSRSLRKPDGGDLPPRDDARAKLQNASPSRLPVKGSIMSLRSAANTTSAASSTGPGGGPASERSNGAAGAEKPKTRGLFGRSNSIRQPAKETAPMPAAKSRAIPAIPTRTASTRQAQAAGSSAAPSEPSRPPITSRTRPTPGTRPTSAGSSYRTGDSTSRPTTSSGLPSANTRSGALGHSRAKSSATALTSATTLRPPQRSQEPLTARDVSSRTVSSESTTTATAGGAMPAEKSRPPVTGTGASRTAALHRRQASASTSSAAPSTPTGLSRPPVPSQIRKISPPDLAPTKSSAAPAPSLAAPAAGVSRLRPAFNTNQQHYSPAKSLAPKPLMTAILAPPSPSKLPANVAASAETSRLQTELLQLSLMHRDAATVDAQWRDSARIKLGGQFKALANENKEVSELERGVLEGRNVKALVEWAGTRGGLEEKIQGLDVVLSGLWSMGEPGGKYARAVRRFERWADRMSEVLAARDGGGGDALLLDADGEVVFIGELDAAWKDECNGLGRRLDEWWRVLRDIGEVPGRNDGERGASRSSLETILDASRTLVSDMLAELSIMEQIERDAVAQEMEWIRAMSRGVDEAADAAKARAGAIWRAF
ncbi:hypothetical protein GQ53DRAFT_744200 [Thozetella sp. PMI_491]|nr:hypothetical protein GQ53DRAFT_744200 [Thozetella sp. PMI_491]